MKDDLTEKFIEHEVELRVHDEKFKILEKTLDKLDHKINFNTGIIITSIILPVILHRFGVL